tara:strand:+ start:3050 stop:4399 length:1350 start_codon:yes stop_codon:yes gene_type:complete
MALTKTSFSMTTGQVVNAKDYGAVGNNSTDDTAALQAALTAATGGTLFIPKGAYRVISQLNVPNRTTIVGEGPISTQIYYRTTSTTVFNQLFNFNNVDNIQIEKLGIVCDIGGGCQNTIAIYCSGDAGAVTEIDLSEVYISGFQRYGVFTQNDVYYFTMDRCKVISTSNSVARGGTGTDNGIGLFFGATVNAVRITRSRISSNDVAMESAVTNQKYSLVISGCYFESNGVVGAPVEYDTISLKNWSAVEFTGNYCEANLTGTTTSDSFLRIRSCRGVDIGGNLFAGAFGGVAKSKNLIGISDSCYGVMIHDNEFQDPITNYVYVADGASIAQVYRNYYDAFGTPVVTYANIMAKMTAALVEIDVPYLESVTTGSISAGAAYQAEITITGVPLDRNCTVIATAQGIGANWQVTASIKQDNVVRLQMQNLDVTSNTFTGTVAFRVIKNGSF